jgi:hypothetical protein
MRGKDVERLQCPGMPHEGAGHRNVRAHGAERRDDSFLLPIQLGVAQGRQPWCQCAHDILPPKA